LFSKSRQTALSMFCYFFIWQRFFKKVFSAAKADVFLPPAKSEGQENNKEAMRDNLY
jgi:hypothetical protein